MKKNKHSRNHNGFTYPKNLHHLTPRSRGGKSVPSNLLLIDIERHYFWHKLFGNRTLDEVISLLERLRRINGLR